MKQINIAMKKELTQYKKIEKFIRTNLKKGKYLCIVMNKAKS